jgi:hypothetical protein
VTFFLINDEEMMPMREEEEVGRQGKKAVGH